MPDFPLRIDKIQRWPIFVAKPAPDRVIVINRDWISDAHVLCRPANVVYVLLEGELGRMNSYDDQTLAFVFLSPRADIRKLPPPVDARIRPEFDEHHLPLQLLGG